MYRTPDEEKYYTKRDAIVFAVTMSPITGGFMILLGIVWVVVMGYLCLVTFVAMPILWAFGSITIHGMTFQHLSDGPGNDVAVFIDGVRYCAGFGLNSACR